MAGTARPAHRPVAGDQAVAHRVVPLVASGAEALVVAVGDLPCRVDEVEAVGRLGRSIQKMRRAKDQPQVQVLGQLRRLLPENPLFLAVHQDPLDSAVGDKPERGDQHINAAGDPGIHKRKRNGGEVKRR